MYDYYLHNVATVLTVYGIETCLFSKNIYPYSTSCNSTYRLRYWNWYGGICYQKLHDVATVLTVYGIETVSNAKFIRTLRVATVLTVYGIETRSLRRTFLGMFYCQVATVLTVYGIETLAQCLNQIALITLMVATVLTVYGIETVKWPPARNLLWGSCNSTYRLRYWNRIVAKAILDAQVACCNSTYRLRYWNFFGELYKDVIIEAVATVLTVYGIETKRKWICKIIDIKSCNSTYRLRYWNFPKSVRNTFFSSNSCNSTYRLRYWNWSINSRITEQIFGCNSTYRLRYWNRSENCGRYEG